MNRTAATQLLTQSMRDALSGSFDVADPSGSVTMRSPSWVSGWHAPLLKLTKASIVPNRDDTHTLHRLIDDLFAQLQERLASGVDGPAAFRTLLTDVTDNFDRAPRGAALETLQKFGVPSGTPFSNYLRSFRVVVASTVDKGGPLAPSPEMAMELIRIRTAQLYPTLIPTLFPGILATRERTYDSLTTLWTVFAHLKHNTSPAIDGDAFSPARKSLSSYTHQVAASSNSPITSPNRSMRRFGRQDTAPGVSHISPTHSRRDPFADDYGLWPFDDRDYDIVCTVTNHILNTNLSLWTPLLSEEARRQACVQFKGRCCNCGSTEHSLRWCPAPFRNTFSLLNPEFGTHDSDGSIFETWKLRMRQWRQQNASRGRQGNQKRNNPSNHRSRYNNNRGQNTTYQSNPPGTARTHVTGDARYPPQRTHYAPQTPTMGHGPGTMGTRLANNPTHTPPHGQHNHTPCRFEDGAPSTALSTALIDGLLGTADSSRPLTPSGHSGLRRQVRPSHTPDTVALHGPDPPGKTSVQRCGETQPLRVDIRDLCQPHALLSHGTASLPQGPSGPTVSLKLPDERRNFTQPDHTTSGQEVSASAPSQVRTGVCPQPRPTLTQHTAVVRDSQSRTATAPAAVIPHHFLDAESAFSEGKEDPPHSSWASRSETPVRVPDTNAPAELSPCNGNSAILGQHEACPDRDDNERTRPVTTPSVRPSRPTRELFTPLPTAPGLYDGSLTYMNDEVVLFWQPPSVFSQ